MKPYWALTLLFSSLANAGQIYEFPEFDSNLKAAGIQKHYTPDSLEKLIQHAKTKSLELRDWATRAETGDKKLVDPEIKPQDLLKLAGILETQIEQSIQIQQRANLADQVNQYRNLRALIYSIYSKAKGVQNTMSRLAKLSELKGNADHAIRGLARKRDAKLSRVEAADEASNLVDSTGKEYALPTELEGLTIDEISKLDVRPDNTMWFTKSELDKIVAQYGSNWKRMESELEKAVSARLSTPEKKVTYSLDQARRVLVFDKIETKATSAKISTEDLFGQGWKMKWSEENQSEPINNRLYAALGGKWFDLVYANSAGIHDTMLILNGDPQLIDNPTDCSSIASYAKFRDCMLKSEYTFDIEPHKVKEGIITEEMLNDPRLPISQIDSEKKRKLLNHVYIVFNESSVAFRPGSKIVSRLGASTFSFAGATEDRAKRALVVFSYWIANKDAKDDNNRGVITKSGQFIEFMHDLGASLADSKNAAKPNTLTPDFVRARGDILEFSQAVLYKPYAFREATIADVLWMARKIADLSAEQIRDIISSTKWPWFMQKAMASRLIARRNQLVKLLKIGNPIELEEKGVAKGVSLETPEERRQALADLNAQVGFDDNLDQAVQEFEMELKKAGIKINNGRALKPSKEPLKDSLISFDSDGIGTVNSCTKSILIGFLENHNWPNGLERRKDRSTDNVGLARCYPIY